ncbi:MAG: AAA family ATPase [Planctomycetota bacterium]
MGILSPILGKFLTRRVGEPLKIPLCDTMQSLSFLYRYKTLWPLTLVVSVVLGLCVIAILPRKYASEAKLIVKVGRESVSLDPTATSNNSVMMQKTQEEEINSALEVLASRAIRDEVVREIGAENIISGFLPSSEPPETGPLDSIKDRLSSLAGYVSDLLADVGVRDRYSIEERAANELEELVHISASKKSRVISIYCESKSPDMAKRIVEEMVRFFNVTHSEISLTKGSFELFQDEFEKADQRLENSKREMSNFMAVNQIASVQSNEALLKEATSDVMKEINTLEAKKRAAESRWNRKHPLYQQAAAELEMALNTISWLNSGDGNGVINQTFTNNSFEPDDSPAEDISTDDFDNKASNTDSTTQDLDSEANPYMPLAQKLKKFILFSNELDSLQRKVTKHEQERERAFQKFEVARLNLEQIKRSISNIVLFQPATLNQKPVFPDKVITLAATVLACFGLATLYAFHREYHRPKNLIDNPAILQNQTGIPLLARLPVSREANFRLHRDTSLQKLRSEVFQTVQALLNLKNENLAVMVGIQSSETGNGGSTLATVLASAAAKDFGLKTLLVDCDSKTRAIAKRFRLNGSAGLKEFLENSSDLSACRNCFTPFDLDIMASAAAPTQLQLVGIDGEQIKARLDEIRDQYEIVIFDLPPSDTPSAAVTQIVDRMDRIILVAEHNRTTIESLNRHLTGLNRSGAETWGVVLNKCRKDLPW